MEPAGKKMTWCEFMRLSHDHNCFLKTAYELLGQELDWDTFIGRVRASHPTGKMEAVSERIMRELWEGKRQRPTMTPEESFRQMDAQREAQKEAQKEAQREHNGGQVEEPHAHRGAEG